MRVARADGEVPPLSSSASSGTNVIVRTSWVAPAFMAPVKLASVCLRRLFVFWLSRSTRLPARSSIGVGRRKPRALVFQL